MRRHDSISADAGAAAAASITATEVPDELPRSAGQRIGLIGHSGAGKTTLVTLLMRLYDIQQGAIRIDGQDIAAVRQASLRRSIGLIPQDVILFHRTLMENIRYGRPDASDAEVVRAAQRAHAHEFILGLSDGYQTLVGERGVSCRAASASASPSRGPC